MRQFLLASLLACALSTAGPCAAEEETPPPRAVDNTIEFLAHVMKDGTISAEEKTQIAQLRDAEGPVAFPFDGRAASFQAPDADGKELLDFFYAPANLNNFWLTGSDGMQLFARICEVSEASRARVTQFAASKFNESYEQSSLANGYGPIRDLLNTYFEAYDPLDPTDRDMARHVGHDAMVMVDEFHNDQVPDFIYNWMAPAGYLPDDPADEPSAE